MFTARRLALYPLLVVAILTGCSQIQGAVERVRGGEPEPEVQEETDSCEAVDRITVQLSGPLEAQHGGFLAASALGMYEQRCLDVELLSGKRGDEVVRPERQLAAGAADFSVGWVAHALAERERGANLVNIAQVYQRSGTVLVSFADQQITTVEALKDKKVGYADARVGFEMFAAVQHGELDATSDVQMVEQKSGIVGLVEGDFDSAQLNMWREFARLLRTTNADTERPFVANDFTVVSLERAGVGMLQDGIWADADRLDSDVAYRDAAIRFVAASLEGWVLCRDSPDRCAQLAIDGGAETTLNLQQWQMNEVNKLIWPSPLGIGVVDDEAWRRTVRLAQTATHPSGNTVLAGEPTKGAVEIDIYRAALELLDDVDLRAVGYTAPEVVVER